MTLNLRSAVRIGRRGALLATLVAAWAVAAFAQARLDPRLLAAKKSIGDQQQAALAAPFTGRPMACVLGFFPSARPASPPKRYAPPRKRSSLR